jgi:hypothetical protein
MESRSPSTTKGVHIPLLAADGALEAQLACAEPRCGAHITACVLHLTPCEYQSLAEAGQHPGLPKSHEARLVSRALEGALQHLKQQCPALLSSRRERSLARSLPLLGSALAGRQSASCERRCVSHMPQ